MHKKWPYKNANPLPLQSFLFCVQFTVLLEDTDTVTLAKSYPMVRQVTSYWTAVCFWPSSIANSVHRAVSFSVKSHERFKSSLIDTETQIRSQVGPAVYNRS